MKKVYKNLCHAMTNACKISAVMWKSSLRVVEFCAINNFSVSVHNLILLPNGTYFLDVPCMYFSVFLELKSEALGQAVFSGGHGDMFPSN